MEEYKSLSRTHNTKLGGLGANFDDHWEDKVKKNEKVKQFSKMIRGLNNEKITRQTIKPKTEVRQIQNEPTLKEKALDFSKKVPKPKTKKLEPGPSHTPQMTSSNKKKIETYQIDEEIDRMEDDLDALERQHQFYQEKINKLKA